MYNLHVNACHKPTTVLLVVLHEYPAIDMLRDLSNFGITRHLINFPAVNFGATTSLEIVLRTSFNDDLSPEDDATRYSCDRLVDCDSSIAWMRSTSLEACHTRCSKKTWRGTQPAASQPAEPRNCSKVMVLRSTKPIASGSSVLLASTCCSSPAAVR